MRGGGSLKAPVSRFLAYTLAEIIVVMLIIAVIVAVTIGITKAKFDNIVSYTYYNAYSSLRKISTEMLADWDPQDPEYKQALNPEENFSIKLKLANIKNNLISVYKDLWFQPAKAFTDCSVYYWYTPSECRAHGYTWCGLLTTDGNAPPQANMCKQGVSCCRNSGGGNRPGGGSGGGSTCNKSCGSGYTLNKTSCTCVCSRSCGSGYKLNSSSCRCEKLPCTNKPSKIPCGQSWNESTCSLTGSVKTCGSGYSLDGNCNCVCTRTCGTGYKLNSSSCSCVALHKCWDNSYVENSSDCPGYVTCWNGTKAYNWGECPPCPNKPDKIPCGQGWDEHTCQLTGTAKTCPSGQHLNSSCNCVNDCPSSAELTPCRLCSEETGIISTNPSINRTCSDEAYEWSEEQCKCIVSPRTLPRKGENFCKLFERHANIMSGSSVCSGSVISNGITDFSNKSPDITLRNGLRIYNMHSDAGALSMLANNTQGGVYDGVPNTNSYGYTVYVDIDGSKGDSQLWSDVYPFYITLSGKIIPAYDHSANPNGSGGDSVRHLQVSVENENYASGKRSIKWLAKSVPFKEGACIAGYVGDATPYCKNGTPYTQAVECSSNSINSFCRVKQIQPVKFFF